MSDPVNNFSYATRFEEMLAQKYSKELASSDLTDQGVSFIGAQTVKIPTAAMGGYKPHDRDGGFSRGGVTLTHKAKALAYDRSIEFFVDAMDVDETNQAATAAKLTNVFLEEQAIPELDAYRFSKLYYEYTQASASVDDEALTVNNVLLKFDSFMEALDEAGAPADGRVLYVTPRVNSLIKNAVGVYRTFGVQSGAGRIDRAVSSLDNVKIVSVPAGRMRTAYVMTNGFTPDSSAGYINMILLHPSAVIAVQKHSAIYLWPAGQHQKGDGWLYQNRRYGDLFLIDEKIPGIKMNVTSASPSPPPEPDEIVAFTASANGSSGAAATTAITVTLSKKVAGLAAAKFKLASEAANTIAITGATTADEGGVYTLAVTVAEVDDARDITLTIEDVTGYEFHGVGNVFKVYYHA